MLMPTAMPDTDTDARGSILAPLELILGGHVN